MAVWLISFNHDPPQYEATREDGVASVRVPLTRDDWRGYFDAARMMRARVIGRWEDAQPVFAAHADNLESVRFAEMLNE
jgi:hypothetical protein